MAGPSPGSGSDPNRDGGDDGDDAVAGVDVDANDDADADPATPPVGAVTDDGEIVTARSREGDDPLFDSSTLRKLWAVVVALGLGFGASLLSFVVVVGLVGGLQLFAVPLPRSPLALIAIEFLLGQLLVMGGLSAAYLWATARPRSFVGLSIPSPLQWVVVLLGPFVVFGVTVGINILGLALGVESSSHALTEIESIAPTFYLALIPFMLLIVGPFEELLYRGVIQSRLRESFGPVSAILGASVIFALIHLPAYGLGGGSPLSVALSLGVIFAGSLVFGGIYEWTRNLPVVALIHGLYNSLQLVLLYVVTIYEDELMDLAEPAALLVGI